jgi:TniQ
MKLGLTVPLGDAETPASFTSRLAAANGVKAADFCLDWDLRFQAVVDGDTNAISAIGRMGGADAGALLDHAFVRRAPLMYEHRGQRLTRAAMRRARVFICPGCATDDIARLPDVKPHLAVHARGAWLINAVRTCPDHGMGLIDVTFDEAPGKNHDFAYQVRPSIPKLAGLLAGAVKRRPSGLELYVFARLTGTARSEFLDRLDLFAAIKTCEVLGAVALFGTRVNLRTLPDEKMVPALARGFEIAQRGPAGIREFLDQLVAAAGNRRRKDGPGATFGRIHQWLMAHQRDRA